MFINYIFGADKFTPRLITFTLTLLLFTVIFLYTFSPIRRIELLESKWGKNQYAQFNEELIIRDVFEDKKSGFFVDIGANHYKKNSTTYYLDKNLGWQGIAVDALVHYQSDYKKYRPNVNYLNYFISDKSHITTDFYQVLENSRLSSNNKNLIPNAHTKHTQVDTITLNDLLKKHKVKNIDLLSIDIELSEIEALNGFDIDKYKPKLVCIEVHEPVREKVYEYFKSHNYKELKVYSAIDPLNAYFTPNAVELNS